jgi:hypothetical protein
VILALDPLACRPWPVFRQACPLLRVRLLLWLIVRVYTD